MKLIDALRHCDMFSTGDYTFRTGDVALAALSPLVQKDCAFQANEDQFFCVYMDLHQEVTVNHDYRCITVKVGFSRNDPEPQECDIFLYREVNMFPELFE